MARIKKMGLVAGVVFIAIQFIQPARNKSGQLLATDISKIVSMPYSVQAVLKTACYDCHSNNTNYPWYANIQPVGWLMAKHINQGKEVLNFSEFGSYSSRKQLSKLTGIANSINDDIMPLFTFKMMHKSARLSKNNKAMILNWVQHSKDVQNVKE